MAAPTRPHPYFENLGWEIQYSDTALLRMQVLGRYPVKIRPEYEEALRAWQQVLILHNYENPCDYIGSYMLRDIAGTGGMASGHAYGVCIDFDYGGDTDGDGDPTIDKNPHLHRRLFPGDRAFGVECQILEAQVRALEAIRTVDGRQVWTWRIGWGLGDTMHWEPAQGPDIGAIDWDTVQGPEPAEPEEENMPDLETFVAYVRKVDIVKMGDDHLITPSETVYFTGIEMWEDDDTKLDPTHPDWANLYHAYRVRSPIWAV